MSSVVFTMFFGTLDPLAIKLLYYECIFFLIKIFKILYLSKPNFGNNGDSNQESQADVRNFLLSSFLV